MYAPGHVPDAATQAELEAVSRETENPSVVTFTLAVQAAAPAQVFDGLMVYADGTAWDPGSGEGIYAYYNSTWNKL